MDAPFDIIVVGAGIVGCAVAHELASRGASVEIVDERPVGMGATQASAGVLAPYIEALEGSPLSLSPSAASICSTTLSSASRRRAASRCSYRRTGTLDVAFNDAELPRCRRPPSARAARRPRADARRAGGPRGGAAARRGRDWRLLIESHGFVAASDLTRALASAARRKGAQLIERSRVRKLRRRRRHHCRHDRGSLTSNAVVRAPAAGRRDRGRGRRRRPCRCARSGDNCSTSAGQGHRFAA